MGVGAIFISSLALHKLPQSHGALSSEEEILATSLETIVAFVVLCSIIIRDYVSFAEGVQITDCIFIDGLSIPVCELGKRVFSSKKSSTPTARNGEPALAADISIDPEIVNHKSTERPISASQLSSFTHVSVDLEKGRSR